MPKATKPKFVGWFPSATATDYEAGIDTDEKHSFGCVSIAQMNLKKVK